jgi:hypothetical protein
LGKIPGKSASSFSQDISIGLKMDRFRINQKTVKVK